jgi:hypothetical protein
MVTPKRKASIRLYVSTTTSGTLIHAASQFTENSHCHRM